MPLSSQQQFKIQINCHDFICFLGRPLTKKSLASVKQSTDDDEGYGTCSPANPKLIDNVFTFVKTPLCPTVHIVNKVSEDEWSALEKDLNRALNMQPLTERCATKPKEFNVRVTKRPLHSLANYGSKQLRVGCQFCAKNGELRSVVIYLRRLLQLERKMCYFKFFRQSLIRCAIRSRVPSFVRYCASMFVKCVELQGTTRIPNSIVTQSYYFYKQNIIFLTKRCFYLIP